VIVIRLELWPQGDESKKRLLGVAQIANVGGTADLGDYDAIIFKSPEYATRPGVWRRGQVSGFHRRSRRVGPWELLWLALEACGVGERARRMKRS
jgi:hypothetical protein